MFNSFTRYRMYEYVQQTCMNIAVHVCEYIDGGCCVHAAEVYFPFSVV